MENKEIIDKLSSESLDSIREAAGYLSDLASSYSTMSRDDADIFSEQLLETFEHVDSLALSEKRDYVRDNVLDALVQITSVHVLPEKSWDKLTESMNRMNPQELEYTIAILGNTHDPTHMSIIEKYLDHSVEFVRKAAEGALRNIQDESRTQDSAQSIDASVGKDFAWMSFVCGLLTNVVLYFAPKIGHAMHNDNIPLVFMFVLYIVVYGFGIEALRKRQRLLPILGILFSLPSLSVFLWIVFVHIIPFYVRWFNGELV